jgi:hypothetical protein
MKKKFRGKGSSKELQASWTDEILIPLIDRCVDPTMRQHIPRSYKTLRSNSKVGDWEGPSRHAPRCVSLRPHSLDQLWKDIVKKTEKEGFEEFSGAFLVAIGKWGPTFTCTESVEATFKEVSRFWDMEMDMSFVPVDTFEMRMETEFRLSQ